MADTVQDVQPEKINEAIVLLNNGDMNHQTQQKATQQAPGPSEPTHSIPPHMRPDFQSRVSRQSGLQGSKHAFPPNEASTGPRNNHVPYEFRRDWAQPEQVVRLRAELIKVKSELHAERSKALELRQTLEASHRENVDAAFSTMLTTLLHQQTEALALKAHAQAHERSLQLREKHIQQLEIFLAQGQKHLMSHHAGETGDRPMSSLQLEHAQRQAELALRSTLASTEAQLSLQAETLRLREAAQEMRETQYKLLIRESLLAELKKASATSSISRAEAAETAQAQYAAGFARGVETGRKHACDEAVDRAFLQGYKQCHSALAALSLLRQGKLQVGNEELQFLFDPAHALGLYSVGVRIGRLDAGHAGDGNEKDKIEGDGVEVSTTSIHVPPTPPTPTTPTTPPSEHASQIQNDTSTSVPEIIFPPCPPAKQSFASELRRHQLALHNGDVVLANAGAACAVVGEKEKEEKEEGARTREEQGRSESRDLIDLL